MFHEKKCKIDFQDGGHGAHIRFPIETISDRKDFSYFCIYKSPQYFPLCLESIALSDKKTYFEINFQDGGYIGFPIGTILNSFDLQSGSILPVKLESVGLLIQEKKRKIDFQDGGHGSHVGFPIRTILAISYLHVVLILPTNFRKR